MSVERLTKLLDEVEAALQSAVGQDFQVFRQKPMEQFTKLNSACWIDGVEDELADNIGGSVRHTGRVVIQLVTRVQRNNDQQHQTKLTNAAMNIIESLRENVRSLRAGTNASPVSVVTLDGQPMARIEIRAGYWSLPCLAN